MTHLLIDGKNAVYRAVYASKKSRGSALNYLIRQVSSWIVRYRPSSVHVFWDAPRNEVWRRKIYPLYKNREGNEYIENIKDDINKLIIDSKNIFRYMNIRQYSKKYMEADDLIYATINILYPKKSVIISTDSDMTQIIYKYHNVILYNSSTASEIDRPEHDPVMLKILKGDKADTIEGFRGIGDKKAIALLESNEVYKFSRDNKSEFYTNMALVDLSVCPYLLNNKLYCMKILASNIDYQHSEIINIAKEVNSYDLVGEYNQHAPYFKDLK